MDDFMWLKEAVEKIENKVDCLDTKLNDQNVILSKQAADLSTHIYRTDLAEQNISLLREQIKPIESHVKTVNTIFKLIGIMASVGSVLVGILKLIL